MIFRMMDILFGKGNFFTRNLQIHNFLLTEHLNILSGFQITFGRKCLTFFQNKAEKRGKTTSCLIGTERINLVQNQSLIQKESKSRTIFQLIRL